MCAIVCNFWDVGISERRVRPLRQALRKAGALHYEPVLNTKSFKGPEVLFLVLRSSGECVVETRSASLSSRHWAVE